MPKRVIDRRRGSPGRHTEVVERVAGLICWYRADRKAGANTWGNCSGPGPALTEATNPPTLTANIINGRPVYRFDGTNDILASTAAVDLSANANVTAFCVVNNVLAPDVIMELGANAGTADGFLFYTGNPCTQINGATAAPQIAIDAGWDDTNANIAEIRGWNGTNIQAWKNGLLVGSTATDHGAMPAGATLYVGNRTGGTLWLTGDIAEIIIYDRALAYWERRIVRRYLSVRYAIAAIDTTVKDYAGAKDGVMTAMAPATDYVTAATAIGSGYALDFDGTDGYVSVGNVGTGIKTISFWINADDVSTRKILNCDGTDQVEIDLNGDVTATSFPGTTAIYVDGVSATRLTINTWHHVCITDTTGVAASVFEIGRVGAAYFDGTLDDVKLFDRVITAAELAALVAHSTTSADWPGDPVGHWSFDHGDI